jgi:hypothetical protein
MSFTTNPGYYDLFNDLYSALTWFYAPEMFSNYSFPKTFFDDFQKYYYFEHDDYFLIIYIGIIITILRYIFELYICNVSIINHDLY